MKQFFLALAVSTILFLGKADSQIVVIVNKSVPVHALQSRSILDIYSLNTKEWPDGSPVVAITLKGSESTAQDFFSSLGTRLLDMKKLWMRMLLLGEEQVPLAVNSEDDVVAKVASTPGAIGFVRKAKADPSVRIVATVE